MIEVATSSEQLRRCMAIRFEVFVGEQGVPGEVEVDGLDAAQSTIHLLASRDGVDLGTARILPDGPGRCYIGRVAVRRAARGTGVGRALMDRAAELALERLADGGHVEIVLSAQERAMGFYRSCGYEEVDGERYLDAGIWHRDMAARFAVESRPRARRRGRD